MVLPRVFMFLSSNGQDDCFSGNKSTVQILQGMKTRTGGNDGLTVLTTRSRVNQVRYINNMCLSRMWYSSSYTLATSKGFEFEQVLGLCFKSKLRYILCSLRLTVRTIASQARNALVQLLQGMILTLRNPLGSL